MNRIEIPKLIPHPLSIDETAYPVSVVLRDLAAQEGSDGQPYDTMMLAAEYIELLESELVES